jgi:hypothetical protein
VSSKSICSLYKQITIRTADLKVSDYIQKDKSLSLNSLRATSRYTLLDLKPYSYNMSLDILDFSKGTRGSKVRSDERV